MRYINNILIDEAYSMRQCIEDVTEGLKYYLENKANSPLRSVINHASSNATTLYMPSYIEGLEYEAVKVVSIFPNNKEVGLPSLQGVILLTETKNGQHVATIEASKLTVKRTGALSGIATKYLSNWDANHLSILGCGAQARGQFEAVINVRPITKLFLWNRTKDTAVRFKNEIQEDFPDWKGEIYICEKANEAAATADVLVLSTKSDEALFDAKVLKPGVHINAIGAYQPDLKEFGADTLNMADQVWVDTMEGVKHEAGDLIQPVDAGQWSWEKVDGELAELVFNDKVGRKDKDEITLFKSVGVAYIDTIVAAKVYEMTSKVKK